MELFELFQLFELSDLVDVDLTFARLQTAQAVRTNLHPNQAQCGQPDGGGHTPHLAIAPFADLDF
jgi:hypothetical protein